MLIAFIFIPLLGIMLLNLPFWSPRKTASWFGFTVFAFQVWLALFSPASLWTPLPFKLPFAFEMKADSLTVIMLLSIGIVAFISLLLAQYTIHTKEKRFNFVNLLLLAALGMNGVVLVADLFSLYVFLEIVAVASFVLIASQQEKLALEGAMKYVVLSSLATVLMLFAIAFLLLTTGTTSFAGVNEAIKAGPNSTFTLIAAALFLCGLFIKGGLVPFHGWLPDAYSSAPAEVSVLLAGIVTKVSGIYTMMRLITAVFGFTPQIQDILLAAGAVSVVAGAFAALKQDDLKRMLAYSSISQVGYIVLGLGAGTGIGLAGAAFHLFNHSIFKSQLFANAAAIERQAGTRSISELGGLSDKMRVTSVTSLIAMLSTAGVPPLAGFWSKLLIIVALWAAGFKVYALIAVLASIVTLAYFLSMNRRVFFGDLPAKLANIKEAKTGILVPSAILAAITVGAGLIFPVVMNSLIKPLLDLL